MWKRRETETSSTNQKTGKRNAQVTPSRKFTAAPARKGPSQDERIVNIGQSICIHGELTGNEDLTIEGEVQGTINLKEHNLTIGPNGRIQAQVAAKTVVVQGELAGNITASEKVELAETCRMRGDIIAPRIVIADGACFKGLVDMPGEQPDYLRQASSSTKGSPTGEGATSP